MNIHKTLKTRLLVYFFSVIGFISCGALFSLIVVSNVENRTDLLIDKYWRDNNIIAQAHDLLGEVLLYVDLHHGDIEATASRKQLQQGIDNLIVAMANASFQEDFRIAQTARLRQLNKELDAPAELLGKGEQHRKITSQVKKLSIEFRERTELYARNIINPTHNMIKESLSLISVVLLGSLGLGGMMAASLSIYFAERISLPIESAAATLIHIEKGELKVSLTLTGIEEIDKLNQSIVTLAMSLRQSIGGQLHRAGESTEKGQD